MGYGIPQRLLGLSICLPILPGHCGTTQTPLALCHSPRALWDKRDYQWGMGSPTGFWDRIASPQAQGIMEWHNHLLFFPLQHQGTLGRNIHLLPAPGHSGTQGPPPPVPHSPCVRGLEATGRAALAGSTCRAVVAGAGAAVAGGSRVMPTWARGGAAAAGVGATGAAAAGAGLLGGLAGTEGTGVGAGEAAAGRSYFCNCRR